MLHKTHSKIYSKVCNRSTGRHNEDVANVTIDVVDMEKCN